MKIKLKDLIIIFQNFLILIKNNFFFECKKFIEYLFIWSYIN